MPHHDKTRKTTKKHNKTPQRAHRWTLKSVTYILYIGSILLHKFGKSVQNVSEPKIAQNSTKCAIKGLKLFILGTELGLNTELYKKVKKTFGREIKVSYLCSQKSKTELINPLKTLYYDYH